ncbi:MAG TPA: hypothetical protein VGS22_10740 [Thermoanaerobaculia bacterium]|jgi:hypothetical protein|nr:hypothetical protein [Thermoanaerobaculia bacterium]
MAATGKSLAERISRVDLLVNNLGRSIEDWPHLSEEVVELKAMVVTARALSARQDALRAEAQENTAALNDIANRADKLRNQIGAGIRSKLGFTSEMLIQFGFRPRPTGGRRAKKRGSGAGGGPDAE